MMTDSKPGRLFLDSGKRARNYVSLSFQLLPLFYRETMFNRYNYCVLMSPRRQGLTRPFHQLNRDGARHPTPTALLLCSLRNSSFQFSLPAQLHQEEVSTVFLTLEMEKLLFKM